MNSLYNQICDYRNLELAFRKASKGKTKKQYVKNFEADLERNLLNLRDELEGHTYSPKPLSTFILRDPKTRRISRSDFRDRVVHHALCNVIEPIFEKVFIFDSYANRKGKGSIKAIERFEIFSRKCSKNFSRACFVLKADIRKYFDSVDHKILLSVIQSRVSDERVLWLCREIIHNFHKSPGKGMPLGNLTSQFFANVYLNEFDQFVKHELKVKYYVRYVDDFVIFSESIKYLDAVCRKIGSFLMKRLKIQLHPEKSRVLNIQRGIDFLGMRIFPKYRLLRRRNLKKFKRSWTVKLQDYCQEVMIIDELFDFLQGWCAYAKHAATYSLRTDFLTSFDNKRSEITNVELNQFLKYKKR